MFRRARVGAFVAIFLLGMAAFCQSKGAEETTVEGCLSEKAGVFALDNGFGQGRTLLTGKTVGLSSHVGDELSVTGFTQPASNETDVPEALDVSSFRTILKRQPDGVQPQIRDSATWSSFRSAKFGVGMRNPSKWTALAEEQLGISANFVNDKGIEFLHAGDVPREVYPDSNFVGGQFALIVDSAIGNAGSCRQFGKAEEGVTSLRINGVAYSEAGTSSVGMGTGHSTYSVHTFQNGYCYEFDLEFDEQDGTGMDLACTVQWLTGENEQRFLKSLVSQVSFAVPEMPYVVSRRLGLRPTVTSVLASPLNSQVGVEIEVSWATEGADYVQLRYPCIRGFDTNGMGGLLNGRMQCGPVTDANYPPNGSGTILLLNNNTKAVSFVLTVVPYRDGAADDQGAKAVTVSVPLQRK
jgi:hypothetical protein